MDVKKGEWSEIANRFQVLEVEDLPDVDEEEIISLEDSSDILYELEEESEEMRMCLMIFSFFEDLHRMQDFLHAIWKRFKVGKIGLMTASLITNATFDVVSQNEEEILAASPSLFNKKKPYNTIAIVIFYADAFSQGQNPEERLKTNESLRPTPFDDFIYLSVARILMKFVHFSRMPELPPYPIPAFPLRFGYITRPELLGTPYMNKKEQEDVLLSQYFMDLALYDKFSAMCKERKAAENPPPAVDELSKGLRALLRDGIVTVSRVFAARILLDLQDILKEDVGKGHQYLTSIAKNAQRALDSTGVLSGSDNAICWLAKDAHLVRELWELNSIWTVGPHFSAWKTLMIQAGSLSDPERGELVDGGTDLSLNSQALSWSTQPRSTRLESQSTEPSLSGYSTEDRSKAKGANMRGVKLPTDPEFTTVRTAVTELPSGYKGPFDQETLRKWMRDKVGWEDDGVPVSQEHEENARRLDLRLLDPNLGPDFVLTQNPIRSGTLALSVVAQQELTGLTLCNYHTVTTLVAYLYSEVRRAKLLDMEWPEMEQMIDIHQDTMFSGKLPQSASEAYIRYTKLMGLSTGRTPNRHQRGLPYKEPQHQRNAVSSTVRPYLCGKTTFRQSLRQLELFIQAKREAKHHESKHKRRNARRKLTPLQFLMQLEEYLPEEMRKIRFDYITLTKNCHMLMEKFRHNIERELGLEHPTVDLDGYSIQPLGPDMVMSILQEAKETPQSRQYEVIAKTLKRYLDGGIAAGDRT
ncbi:hypothetical protein LZ554_003310 [Drepanopeziza brunnea f. sp. 'monogermtubi']|nr:hypothetical protein LZ554_003310 [Drepanopeziza brunnea f. sp. 'monogermtubi']